MDEEKKYRETMVDVQRQLKAEGGVRILKKKHPQAPGPHTKHKAAAAHSWRNLSVWCAEVIHSNNKTKPGSMAD